MTGNDRVQEPSENPASIRIDKWLFFCRGIKSRSLAAKLVGSGQVSVNGVRISNASRTVKPGDTVSFSRGSDEAVYRIVSCGTRRGPASEAQLLYEDISAPKAPKPLSALDRLGPVREPGAGRPTKRERRQTEHLRIDRDPVAKAGRDDDTSS